MSERRAILIEVLDAVVKARADSWPRSGRSINDLAAYHEKVLAALRELAEKPAQPAHQPAAAPVAGASGPTNLCWAIARVNLGHRSNGCLCNECKAEAERIEANFAALTPSPVAPDGKSADYHSVQETMADAAGYDEAAEYHRKQRLAPVATEETQRLTEEDMDDLFDLRGFERVNFTYEREFLKPKQNALADCVRKIISRHVAQPPAGTPEQATGPTIRVNNDGVWLLFADKNKGSAALDIEEYAVKRGGIVGEVIKNWCDEQREAALGQLPEGK